MWSPGSSSSSKVETGIGRRCNCRWVAVSRVTVVGETGDNIIVGKAGVGTVVVTRRGWSGEKKSKNRKTKETRYLLVLVRCGRWSRRH